MIFGLLATELPADRRSAALNLVYLPLYAGGIIGPAAGAVVASLSGVHGLFVVGGVRLPVRGGDDPPPPRPGDDPADPRADHRPRGLTDLRGPIDQPGRRRATTTPAKSKATREPPARARASRASTNR